ncbi:MAG: heparinase II/III family protein [Planctomycetota bacterium]
MYRRSLLVLLFFTFALLTLQAHARKLDTLKPDHPRILADSDDFDRVAALVKNDPLAKRWYGQLKSRAQEMLDEPVAVHELRDERRLLYVSREVLARVKTLALLHRIEPDERYVERVWADVQAASGFDDWHPDHFLDVAEMAFAFALAYDWLHEDWTEDQRQTMRDAMVRHAIQPALMAHQRGAWWTRTKINWNQVCHGGLIAASLAIAEHEPELAEQMIDLAVQALAAPMSQYKPDGGYEEGPGYWGYGTIYNVIAIASLQSGLGTDFDLGNAPGFKQTASFPVQMIGTSGKFFNFGDNKERVSASPALFWFAKAFFEDPGKQPIASITSARYLLDRVKASPLTLLWYDPNLADVQFGPDLKSLYQSAGVASMRSGWGSDATFLGAKGGRVHVGHSQMDLGSFVLDHDGVRWVVDLGADDYNLPGYFEATKGGNRWHYYRSRAEGHNTLVINPGEGGGQRYGVKAGITQQDWSINMDLSDVYSADVRRMFEYVPGSKDYTVITDTITLDEPGEVWWFAHSRAAITLSEDGRSARLEQEGKTMHVRLLSPEGVKLSVMDAKPLPTSPNPKGQNPNNGAVKINAAEGVRFVQHGSLPTYGEADPNNTVRKLAIRLRDVEGATIRVEFSPFEPEP